MSYLLKKNFFSTLVNGKNSLRRIALILLMLALVPTAFYTVYEFSSLNANEEILSEMYSRQLDAILYSVNDHTSSVMTSWANRMSKLYESKPIGRRWQKDSVTFEREFNSLCAEIQVENFQLSDSTGKDFFPPEASRTEWDSIIIQNAHRLEKLPRYLRLGYRLLEPLYLRSGYDLLGPFFSRRDSTSRELHVFIVFAVSVTSRTNLMGVFLNEQEFIRKVIGTKLKDISGDSFILGVIKKDSNQLIFSTSDTEVGSLHQRKRLWLFPGHELAIRLKGTTIDELAQSRTKRNLLLIVLMDVVLLAGAWFVYRSIRYEMELVRLKSDFVSNVSHELRTPLALIRMYGETLEMGRVKSDEKRQEYYGTIVKESERLTRLVNNILDFSKMEAGKKEYSFTVAQLNDVIRNVMATYEYHLKAEGFASFVELDDAVLPVRADVETITEAVVNLIDNAVKYSGENKYLKVKTLRENDACVVEVEDHGIGIAAEHHSKIFDKFFRVGSALVHNTKGSGLGLALVKHIMDAHNGKVEVASTIGVGSTFRLIFPFNITEKS